MKRRTGKKTRRRNGFSFIKKTVWFGLLLYRVLLLLPSDKFNFKCVTCTLTRRKEIVVKLNVTTRHSQRNLFSRRNGVEMTGCDRLLIACEILLGISEGNLRMFGLLGDREGQSSILKRSN